MPQQIIICALFFKEIIKLFCGIAHDWGHDAWWGIRDHRSIVHVSQNLEKGRALEKTNQNATSIVLDVLKVR